MVDDHVKTLPAVSQTLTYTAPTRAKIIVCVCLTFPGPLREFLTKQSHYRYLHAAKLYQQTLRSKNFTNQTFFI